ncbi:MAG: DNA replication/repair protein RecF [Chlamydiae bacterium]|nr:DNA replication/repair protein RecF [Chlamydiota bacterium]
MVILRSLCLRNFRNYKEIFFSFKEGVNSIEGDNGHGKTNLLEALFLLSVGRSFRTSHLQELVKQGESSFYIEALFERDGIDQKIKIGFSSGEKKIFHNDTPHSHFSSLLGLIPQTLYTPFDIEMIVGAPQIRRRFLNLQIAQVDPKYAFHLTRYAKALGHRNALLKEKRSPTIAIWEEEMAKSAAYIVEARRKLLLDLSEKIIGYYHSLVPSPEEIELRYQPSLHENFQEHWEKNRAREYEFKATLNGPHRDDFVIMRDKKNAKIYASEGQKRSLIAAIKFAEFALLKERSETPPILGIDDFGVHLDEKRSSLFKEQLKHVDQVFVTTPIPLNMNAHRFQIVHGELTDPSIFSCVL